MTYTLLPSIKGQITLPSPLREKYAIGKDTPLVCEDDGNGIIKLLVKKMIDYDDILYVENEHGVSLTFKHGIDPRVLLDNLTEYASL